jgi:hypothetical protein
MGNCWQMCCDHSTTDQMELLKAQMIANDPSKAEILNLTSASDIGIEEDENEKFQFKKKKHDSINQSF